MEALDIVTKAAEHANEKMKQTVREEGRKIRIGVIASDGSYTGKKLFTGNRISRRDCFFRRKERRKIESHRREKVESLSCFKHR